MDDSCQNNGPNPTDINEENHPAFLAKQAWLDLGRPINNAILVQDGDLRWAVMMNRMDFPNARFENLTNKSLSYFEGSAAHVVATIQREEGITIVAGYPDQVAGIIQNVFCHKVSFQKSAAPNFQSEAKP